jgi:acyl dehydratase
MIAVGTEIPPWTMSSVDPAKMKTMAALLADPYPIHWDRKATASLGRGERVINQGPLNLGYVVNMLLEWQGPTCLRRLQASFHQPVFDDESVTARGIVTALTTVDGERRAECDVRLDRDGEALLTGTAVVALLP